MKYTPVPKVEIARAIAIETGLLKAGEDGSFDSGDFDRFWAEAERVILPDCDLCRKLSGKMTQEQRHDGADDGADHGTDDAADEHIAPIAGGFDFRLVPLAILAGLLIGAAAALLSKL